MKSHTLILHCLSSLKDNTVPLKRALLIIMAIPLLLQSGCCNDREKSYLPEKVYEYVFFKPGSYWIYTDQNMRVDTFKVIESRITYGKAGSETCDETEAIYMKYSSSLVGDLYASCTAEILDVNNFLGNTLPWPWPAFTSYIQKYLQDTIMINGYAFDEVYTCEIYDGNEIPGEYRPIKYYLAKNAGIIKKEYSDGSVFSVIEYHIEK